MVGEDLGTVEPWVRDYLAERGILGTSILWFEFEFDGSGAPLRPEWWREYCLASVTTHDLPPTAGYLAGDHVRLRDPLGLLTRSVDEELAADEAERSAWLEELRRRGALEPAVADAARGSARPAAPDTADAELQATVHALHRYLTWTPAKLISVALSDLVGDRRTQNQPGTIDEYPNWRVPLTGPDGGTPSAGTDPDLRTGPPGWPRWCAGAEPRPPIEGSVHHLAHACPSADQPVSPRAGWLMSPTVSTSSHRE